MAPIKHEAASLQLFIFWQMTEIGIKYVVRLDTVEKQSPDHTGKNTGNSIGLGWADSYFMSHGAKRNVTQSPPETLLLFKSWIFSV